MGSWYRVIKTIKGHRYIYEQRTRREGKHVRTESRYLGRAGNGDAGTRGNTGASVNTTKATDLSAAIVDEVLADLTRLFPQQHVWTHGWDASRQGKNLVKRVQEIDETISKLTRNFTWSPDGAFYNHSTDVINIPQSRYFFDADEETATQAYYATLLHELAHWTGRRLNRIPSSFWISRVNYAREELVAEATAIILMRHFKIAPENLWRHADYFQHWLSRAGEREEALSFARREADRAARFILGVNTTARRSAGDAV